MSERQQSTSSRDYELDVRHIMEMGALYAKFLNDHPDIDRNFIDDTTTLQEAEWAIYSSDVRTTQAIEKNELSLNS